MNAVERFEELVAWQKARKLTQTIYTLTRSGAFSKDYGLSNQIQRASVSVMSNIAEGFERRSIAEFHRFLAIAKGSCAEVRSLLYVAVDVGYLAASEFQQVFDDAEETARVLGGLRAAVERKRNHTRGKP